jgi:polyhydroxybutyrate depolymerase
MVRRRRGTLGAVMVMLSLPLLLAAIEAVSYHTTNRNNGTILVQGLPREYLLYVPSSYDAVRPAPLVISLHGGGSWPAAERTVSQWNRVADAEGLIVVYPAGVDGDGPRMWHMEGTRLTADVEFITTLIDTLSARYRIDSARIYVDGLSNGAGMAFVLSCRIPDRIAAVGLVAAAHLLPWSWCTDKSAVPMIAFHGTDDPATPYHGGKTWVARAPFPSIPLWTRNWAERNRCAPTPVDTTFATDVSRRQYMHCADDTAVVLYTILGGGHSWPGGGPLPEWLVGHTSQSVDATPEMWAFFVEHPLVR